MTLVHWDQNTRKYVLYRNTGEHNEDCKPFERIPKRVLRRTGLARCSCWMHCSGFFDSANTGSGPRRSRSTRWTRCRWLLRGVWVSALTRLASARAADAHGSPGY